MTSPLKLFAIQGNFKLGGQAKAAKSTAGTQMVPAEMTEQTYVKTQPETAGADADISFPDEPITLDATLRLLNAAGSFPTIFKHDCKKNEDKFTVKHVDDLVFLPDVNRSPLPSSQPLDQSNVSSKVNYLTLQCAQIVQVLKYSKEGGTLKQSTPECFLPANRRIKAGETYQL